jgi:hypothetical protein
MAATIVGAITAGGFHFHGNHSSRGLRLGCRKAERHFDAYECRAGNVAAFLLLAAEPRKADL